MLKYQNAQELSHGNYSVRPHSVQGVDTNSLQSLSSEINHCLFAVLSSLSGKALGGKQHKLNGADLGRKIITQKDIG